MMNNAAQRTASADSGVPLPPYIEGLWAPLRAALVFFVFSMWAPDDDFVVTLQKLAAGLSGPIGVLIAVGTSVQFFVSVDTPQFGDWVTLGAYQAMGGSILLFWAFIKCRWITAATGVDVALVIVQLATLILSVSYMSLPLLAAEYVGLHAATLLHPRVMHLLYGMTALSFCITAYNWVLLPPDMVHASYLAAVPEPRVDTAPWVRAWSLVLVFSVWVVVLVMHEVTLRESLRQTLAAKASEALASALAASLQRYDTALAQALILEARAEGVASTLLLDRFESIVENLNRYRPHLPNWVVDTDVDDPDFGLSNDSTAGRTVSEYEARETSDTTRPHRSAHCSPRSDTLSQAHADGSPISLSGTFTAAPAVGKPPLFLDSPRRTCGFLPCRSGRTSASSASTKLPDLPTRVVVHAELGFVVPYGTGAAQSAHTFVDRVFEVAMVTGAAVHSFVGDVVRVTWNAASRVVQPETKATRFLARMRSNAAEKNDDADVAQVDVWGAAWVQEARVLMGGIRRQQALLVGRIGEGAGLAATTLAKRFRTMVCDGRVYATGCQAAVMRGVGIAQPVGTAVACIGGGVLTAPLPKWRGLFEVLAEHGEMQDEWIYVLQKMESRGSPHASLCEAVFKILEGNRDMALACVREVVGSISAEQPVEPIVQEFVSFVTAATPS